MKFIISPTRPMKVDTDTVKYRDLPCFLDKTERILQRLLEMSLKEMGHLHICNYKITMRDKEMFEELNLREGLTPAIFSYDGFQYRCLAPETFTEPQLEYLQEHLRILSGFYGMLRPFDGIAPSHLDMRAKLELDGKKNLYEFWGDSLAKELFSQTDCVVNLAPKEYSIVISRPLNDLRKRHEISESVLMIDCVFGKRKGQKIIQEGTPNKRVRMEMVRYLAEIKAENPEQMKRFCRMDYHFSEEDSTDTTYVFLKEE